MRNLVIAAVIIIAGLALWRYYGGESAEPTANSNNKIGTIHTTKGEIKLELFADKTPITVKNFTDLAGQGFYTDTSFLDTNTTVFGKGVEGKGPVNQIVSHPQSERDGPLAPVRIDYNDVE